MRSFADVKESTVNQVRRYRDRHKAILFANCDPGAFTRRGDNYEESLENWQARAVAIAIDIFDEKETAAETGEV